MNLFLIILIISTTSIAIHELGHCVATLLTKGVTVKEYTVGIGKIVFQKKVKDFTFTLRLLPFGGSCVFDGLMYDGTNIWGHLFIALGGLIANFIAALICILLISLYPTNSTKVIVQDVNPNISILKKGDIVLFVDGEEANLDNLYNITNRPGNNMLIVQREDKSIDTIMLTKDMYSVENSTYKSKVNYDCLSVLHLEGCTVGNLLKYIFNHSISDSFQKFNKIISLSRDHCLLCILIYSVLFNILSVITNSIPLYDLDGGYALIILLTHIRKKPLSHEAEEKYMQVSKKIRDLFLLCTVAYLLTKK